MVNAPTTLNRQQAALVAMDTVCKDNLVARACAGEIVNNVFFLHSSSEVATQIKAEADRLAVEWFAHFMHGSEPAILKRIGVMAYCLYTAYDVIVEVQK